MKRLKVITSFKLFPSLLVLAVILLFNVIIQPGFLSVEIIDGRLAGGLVTIINRSVPAMILAIGMTFVIGTGGIDISVGTVVAITGAVSILLIRNSNDSMPLVLVAIITMLVGIAFGLWNGLLVARVGMPPVVATLILMVAGRGVGLVLTNEASLSTYHPTFGEIASGVTLGIPNQCWIALVVFLLAWFFARRTAFGLFVESTGANKSATTYVGLSSKRIILIAYTLSGLCAGIVGLLGASTTRIIEPLLTGLDLEFSAILAVVLGGTGMKGGKFNLGGSCIGAVILMALTQTMYFYGVPSEFSKTVQAIVIVIVIVIQSSTTRTFITSLFNSLFNRREVSSK